MTICQCSQCFRDIRIRLLGMAAEECPESSALQVAREMMMMMQGVDTDYQLPEVRGCR